MIMHRLESITFVVLFLGIWIPGLKGLSPKKVYEDMVAMLGDGAQSHHMENDPHSRKYEGDFFLNNIFTKKLLNLNMSWLKTYSQKMWQKGTSNIGADSIWYDLG